MLRRTSLFLLTAFLLVPAAAFAQNVLPNPDFDQDLSGWDTTTDTTWSPVDSDGSVSSGSLQIVVSELKSTAISTCVPVTGGVEYQFGADILLDFQGNAEGKAGVVVRWASDANCGQLIDVFPANTFLTSAPDWTTQTLNATAPAEANSALVDLRATKTGGSAGATVTANLDDALLQSLEPTSPSCGDAVSPFGKTTASDALFALHVSVGIGTCDACVCDVNSSGTTTATDALITLRHAVGIPSAVLSCPACG